MLHDIRGLPQTAASAEALRAFDATVEAYLSFQLATGDRLKETLTLDPGMPLAHCLKGCFLLLFAKRDLAARAAKALADATAAGERNGLTRRETDHLTALDTWLSGDMQAAAACYDAILIDHPLDIVALKLAQYLHFYLGDAPAMRGSVTRPFYAWDDDVPGYGYLLGLKAFALEESGDYAGAEAAGREAVEINPVDIWAAHAVAHVMEMQDRAAEGASWIDGLETAWGGCNNFAYHVYWHRCLFLLDQGRVEEVLAHYDGKVRGDRSEDYLDISNAVALLWRLQQRGIEVGDRWDELADKAAVLGRDHMLIFADAHYVMALAAKQRGGEAKALLDSLARFAGGDGTEAEVARDIGLPLGEAILAHAAGRYGEAVETLLPHRRALKRLGGSHAQRDLFEQLLIDAAVKAGRAAVARALLSERAETRRANAWNREMTAAAAQLAAQ
ncbi:tetratricopeptide repeat protein [Pelagibius sp. CAU 1746]|uniref:tetratricopeptide repeat protein n=1 Tax=Pelagibius sp. CAU 1746 TaxID=3140370 RepID=UPI00325A8BD8